MQMEDEAYNLYMWWMKATLDINWKKFKSEFFKRFQGVKEEYFFSTLTQLQQK